MECILGQKIKIHFANVEEKCIIILYSAMKRLFLRKNYIIMKRKCIEIIHYAVNNTALMPEGFTYIMK